MKISQDTEEFAALRDAAQHGPLYAVGRATTWSIAPAFYGSGTVLVGPADADDDGTVALTPPGVWARTPDGHAVPFDRDGWRRSEWASGRLIDEHRPVHIETLSLEDAHRFVAERHPDALAWMETLVRAFIQQLASGSEASGMASDRDEDLAYAAMLDLDASQAFGRRIYEPVEGGLEGLARPGWPAETGARANLIDA